MTKFIHMLTAFVLLGVVSCGDKEEEIIEEKEIEHRLSNFPEIFSAHVEDDGYILVNGALGKELCFSLFNQKLKRVHQVIHPDVYLQSRVYNPHSGMLVLLRPGDSGQTYFSYDDGKSLIQDVNIEPKYGQTWIGYLHLNENSYMLHGEADWKMSTLLTIQNGVQVSEVQKVLDGYSILNGFADQGIIHIIANEVTNTQPSSSPDIYYFYSTDNGKTWDGKYFFGSLGNTDLKFHRIDANTIMLQKPFLSFTFISNDNGKSWRKQQLRTGLTDVDYINKDKAFGISPNTLYETNDSGATWTEKKSLTHKAEYISFLNETTGIVFSKNLIGYTQDGGLSWSYVVGE
jgi:hypothetical protein